MDTNTVRRSLTEVEQRLARIEAEREVLLSLRKGYTGWLQLYDDSQTAQPPLMPQDSAPTTIGKNHMRGSISARSAILAVLREAPGVALHSTEIWERAELMGARTDAATPKDVVDLNLYGLRKRYPIEKVAPRTFRWKNGAKIEG